jgi:phage shock protein PspC (stress-responsive transcriptional regulator)
MKAFLNKLKSRKFLAAVAGVIVGLCMVFGIDESEISNVAGAVVSVASLVAYIVTEGKVDAAAVEKTVELVSEAVETIEVEDEQKTS